MAALQPVLIANVALENARDGATRLRADVDGHEVWFDFRGAPSLQARAEPFVATALLPAIAHGRAIVVNGAPISPVLLKSLHKLRRVINLWNPESHRIAIHADTQAPTTNEGFVTSSFSGGIDSFCTFINHADKITHLVFLNGFDFRADDPWDEAQAHFAATADKLGRPTITGDNNASSYLEMHGIGMPYAHGSLLSGVISYLAPEVGYVASSFTHRELKPWGSHPLLDVLWSTEATRIIHDALEIRRSEKTAIVARAGLLDLVQVCWTSKVGNCGRCTKCIRTMLTLDLLGLDRGPFPDNDPFDHVEKLTPATTHNASYIWDLWKLACETGNDKAALRLGKILSRFRLKRATRNFFKELIGQRLTRRMKAMKGEEWLARPLPLSDPDDLR